MAAAPPAPAPLLLDGVHGGLRHVVDRIEHREDLRIVVARSVRVDEAGEMAALLGLDLPGVGVGAVVRNSLALAGVDRSANLLRFLKGVLLPKTWDKPTAAAHLSVLRAVAAALREDSVVGGGGFKLAIRQFALMIDVFVEEANPYATYAGLRARVDQLASSVDELLKETVTLRHDAPVAAEAQAQAQAQEEEAAAAAAAAAEEAAAEA